MPLERIVCPECKTLTRVRYDAWEDCYACLSDDGAILHVLYPEQLGRKDNPEAGFRHIGEPVNKLLH